MMGEKIKAIEGRKLTKKERETLSPIQQARIEMGGVWIWMEDQP